MRHENLTLRRAASRRGFTLIEVLIILVIIGLLAAILLPVFAKMRSQAETISCSSNLHQVGMAVRLYVNDHGGFYPHDMAARGHCSWLDSLRPYAKTPAVFECPAFEGEYDAACVPGEGGLVPDTLGGYDINVLRASVRRPRVHISRLQHPSSTIFALDGTGRFVNPVARPIIGPITLTSEGVVVRHSGGDNVLFVDGHVKWLSIEALATQSLWSARGPA